MQEGHDIEEHGERGEHDRQRHRPAAPAPGLLGRERTPGLIQASPQVAASTSASRSMSAGERFSVTQTSRASSIPE